MALDPDPLSQILGMLRLRGSVYFKSHLTPPFGIDVRPERPIASFHLALTGTCYVAIPGIDAPVRVAEGDLIVLPNSRGHIVSDMPGRAAERLEDILTRISYPGYGAFIVPGSDEAHTVRLVCGHFEFDEGIVHPVLSSLPPVIHLSAEQTRNSAWINAIFQFVNIELSAAAPGADAIIHRLTEIILIQAIRAFVERAGDAAGCLAGVLDPQIGRSLSAMHLAPAENWSVESLAKKAGLSRTSFSERFVELIGVTPIAYLTTWRMLAARRLLIDTPEPVLDVAARVGYSSDEAFGRAFKKQFDVSPAELRRSLRSTHAEV
jgi:AraC family transcriptional regulator, activator of mtrCDE